MLHATATYPASTGTSIRAVVTRAAVSSTGTRPRGSWPRARTCAASTGATWGGCSGTRLSQSYAMIDTQTDGGAAAAAPGNGRHALDDQ
ncbi:hypothetical protein LY15_003164 [Prauserella flava]|nr:hypothetical protein [Prauserella flava]MCR3734742.1 hypothetical protein [Prauserella salsuginis]